MRAGSPAWNPAPPDRHGRPAVAAAGSPPWRVSPVLQRCYHIHGLSLHLCGETQAVVDQVEAVLTRLGVAPCADTPDDEPRLGITFRVRHRTGGLTLPHDAQPAGRQQGIHAWSTRDGVCLRCPGHIAVIDPGAGVCECVVPRRGLRKDLVTHALLLLLRRRGLFGLHASGVELDGAGWLFVGPRGCGKSTQTYSLVSQGWGFLGDDALLLSAAAHCVEALSLRRDLMLDPTPAFPELAPGEASAQGKLRVRMDRLYAGRLIARSIPRFLVFPEIVPAVGSTLVPVSPAEALMRLVAQSAVFMLDRGAAARHLEVLGILTRQTRAYRLRAGLDLKERPAGVAALLESV